MATLGNTSLDLSAQGEDVEAALPLLDPEAEVRGSFISEHLGR